MAVIVVAGRLSDRIAPREQSIRPTRLRLTRRGRVVLTALIVVPIAVWASAFLLNSGGASATAENSIARVDYVVVKPGQSLWSLATDRAPQSDPRDYIAEILSLNRLSSTSIEPGTRLAVPIGAHKLPLQ